MNPKSILKKFDSVRQNKKQQFGKEVVEPKGRGRLDTQHKIGAYYDIKKQEWRMPLDQAEHDIAKEVSEMPLGISLDRLPKWDLLSVYLDEDEGSGRRMYCWETHSKHFNVWDEDDLKRLINKDAEFLKNLEPKYRNPSIKDIEILRLCIKEKLDANELKTIENYVQPMVYEHYKNKPKAKAITKAFYDETESIEHSPAPSIKELNTLSDFFQKDLKKYYTYRGNYVYEWGWLLWLEKHLPSNSHCTIKVKDEKDLMFETGPNKLYVNQNALKSLKSCLKPKEGSPKRFTVAVLTLLRNKNLAGDMAAHANALIFDMKEKKLYRFDPLGPVDERYNPKKINEALKRWLSTQTDLLKGWTYVSPIEYCPKVGPQMKEDWESIIDVLEPFRAKEDNNPNRVGRKLGFCSAWSLLFLHFRLANPDASAKTVAEYFDSLSNEELTLMIRQYAEFILDTISLKSPSKEEKNNLFKAAIKDDVNFIQNYSQKMLNMNVQDDDGNTALMIAAAKDNLDVIKELLSNGADVTVQNDDGKTAYDFCQSEDCKNLLQIP